MKIDNHMIIGTFIKNDKTIDANSYGFWYCFTWFCQFSLDLLWLSHDFIWFSYDFMPIMLSIMPIIGFMHRFIHRFIHRYHVMIDIIDYHIMPMTLCLLLRSLCLCLHYHHHHHHRHIDMIGIICLWYYAYY